MQAQIKSLFFLVLPDQLVPWYPGSAGFLISLVEDMTRNLGFSSPAGMGSSVHFPCYPKALDLWFPGLVGGREDLESWLLSPAKCEALCSSQVIPRHWIFSFPGLLG